MTDHTLTMFSEAYIKFRTDTLRQHRKPNSLTFIPHNARELITNRLKSEYHGDDNDYYIQFDTEQDLTYFLLRWS
jgi:hypothetical protein